MKIINFLILILLSSIFIACETTDKDEKLGISKLHKVTSAHAGFQYISNSMDAINSAIEKGFKIIELDLFLSTDEKIIVAHPPLKKYYQIDSNNTDYNNFLSLNFRNDENLTFKNPPTIEDIIELSELYDVYFAFDVKFDISNTNRNVLKDFITLLKPHINNYVVYVSYGDYSFESNKKEYDIMRSIDSELYLGFVCLDEVNCQKTITFLKDQNNAYLVTNTHINSTILEEAEENNINSEIYVENNRTKILNYFDMGVDIVMSDDILIK
jgi:glycerophosphoryl diester phosphodiesterase